jgi:outer membrane lipoprotein LolB
MSRAAASAGLALLLLAGCAAPLTRAPGSQALHAQQLRETTLMSDPDWGLTGRIAVSDGRDGGSGQIEWRQQGEAFEIEIRAPVSRRSWRLRGSPRGAVLEGLDGGPRTGADAETLLQREVGWSVPFDDLRAWARGMRGDGGAQLEFDPQQRPAVLRQHGWTVEYRGWDESAPPLPRRVFASNGERRVRLVVQRWHGDERG